MRSIATAPASPENSVAISLKRFRVMTSVQSFGTSYFGSILPHLPSCKPPLDPKVYTRKSRTYNRSTNTLQRELPHMARNVRGL